MIKIDKTMARTYTTKDRKTELLSDIFDCLANNAERYHTSRQEFDEKYKDLEFEIDYTNHIISFFDPTEHDELGEQVIILTLTAS